MQHELTVVEADGNAVEPFKVTDIDIYSGESYSVLLTTNHTPTAYRPGAFWISVGVIGRHPKTLPATAVLRYTNSKFDWPGSVPPETPAWDDIERSKSFTYRIKARRSVAAKQRPPASAALNRTIVMLNTQTMVGGHVKWAINNVSLTLPATPYLGAYFYGLQGSAFDATGEAPNGFPDGYDVHLPPGNNSYVAKLSDRVYELPDGALVDVVLQNADMMRENNSETHPWHLHGHDFLGAGLRRRAVRRREGLREAQHGRPAAAEHGGGVPARVDGAPVRRGQHGGLGVPLPHRAAPPHGHGRRLHRRGREDPQAQRAQRDHDVRCGQDVHRSPHSCYASRTGTDAGAVMS